MSFKAAASDFDGTIYRNEKISDDDIAAVRAWRAAGNKFGIVTGRAFIMLEPLLKLFGLETDFNICCNGAAIYDGDGRIIFQAELEPKLLLDIMNEPCALPTFHFAFEAADEVFLRTRPRQFVGSARGKTLEFPCDNRRRHAGSDNLEAD